MLSESRITPARAGKSSFRYEAIEILGDHPRACGEKLDPQIQQFALVGSPPRVRGKGVRHVVAVVGGGITPARAGKRAVCRVYHLHVWDHPRACGEKSGFHGFAASHWGITPARAGKREGKAPPLPYIWDHPRACGEKGAQVASGIGNLGSPPRVRGKATQLAALRLADRITPARAGKSDTFKLATYKGEDHPRACGEKQ